MATVKVKALENGHDGVQYRHAGEVFEIDKERLKDGSTWFVRLADAPPEPVDAPDGEPPAA